MRTPEQIARDARIQKNLADIRGIERSILGNEKYEELRERYQELRKQDADSRGGVE